MAVQALDTFVGSMPDGADVFVTKGAVYADGHAVVKQWPSLFAPLDLDGKPAPKSGPAKAEAKTPPVKDDPPKATAPARGKF